MSNNQSSSRWHKRIQKLGLIGLILLGANFSFQVYQRYFTDTPNRSGRTSCDLRKKPCTVVLPDDRKVRFSLAPHAATASKPLTMTLNLINFKPDNVYLTLSPLNDIASSRDVKLTQLGEGAFSTEVQLNTIAPNQEDWLFLVHIKQGDQNIAIPFKLKHVGS